jgi:DNA-binding MarR family transcriptional regulator
MIDNYISEFRKFNRFYTAWIGILNKNFMNTKYSLPESRVLRAMYVQEGITSSEIASQLNMDKSYLSRILIAFEKKKLITRKASREDGRVFNLYLTKTGKKDFEKIDVSSDSQAKNLLLQLNEKERELLIRSMSQITDMLSKYKLS